MSVYRNHRGTRGPHLMGSWGANDRSHLALMVSAGPLSLNADTKGDGDNTLPYTTVCCSRMLQRWLHHSLMGSSRPKPKYDFLHVTHSFQTNKRIFTEQNGWKKHNWIHACQTQEGQKENLREHWDQRSCSSGFRRRCRQTRHLDWWAVMSSSRIYVGLTLVLAPEIWYKSGLQFYCQTVSHIDALFPTEDRTNRHRIIKYSTTQILVFNVKN